ncbi:MAG TPA: Flp pilus assembly protein CpaB [Anaerolineales bacterium]
MKRGRVFIYLALIIIIAVAAGGAYLWMHRPAATQPPVSQTTPQTKYVEIVTAGQNINPGTPITEAMLSSIQIPDTALVQGLFTNKADLVNMYAKYSIAQGVPITDSMVTLSPGNVNLPGSSWAPFIPQGLSAVAIPITRLSSVAYGIRDGDYVDIIVTMLLVDVDPTNQSILPNYTASVLSPGNTANGIQLTALIASGGQGSSLGNVFLDPTLNQPIYLVPSEGQRPRLVTQMIMQNVQVLHVGSFPLPGETVSDQFALSSSAPVPTATPAPGGQPQQAVPVVTRPDIVTLMVSPDDANTLVFLIYSGAKITLTLRNPNNTEPAVTTDAAMLEYLLTQYNIPVPAKLPYAIQPRTDNLPDPKLSGDATSAP